MTVLSTNGKTIPFQSYICFSGTIQIATGALSDVALAAWQLAQSQPATSTVTFDRETGSVVDLNLNGSQADIVDRYAKKEQRIVKRGRPKLGVVPREITLLPRHWEWLSQQPGGASVTLRRLVDAARKDRTAQDENRGRITAAYQFMFTMAGDFPLFEEASRALFAQDFNKLLFCAANWPADIRNELMLYLQDVLPKPES